MPKEVEVRIYARPDGAEPYSEWETGRGRDLDMRTRLFVVYHSLEPALQSPLSEAEQKTHLRLRHALLTRR